MEAALQFVLNINEVDQIIIGVNSALELEDLVSIEKNPPAKLVDLTGFSYPDEKVLNPSLWNY